MRKEPEEALRLLYEEYEDCDRCGLCNPIGRTRRNVVFGDGPVNADIMIIGEAPGENEDHKGIPFVGASGVLLDKYLRSFESSRAEVFVTNAVCCRPTLPDDPRRNRPPALEEMEACRSRLVETIDIVDPYVIVLLGASPLKVLSDAKGGITAIARRAIIPRLTTTIPGKNVPVHYHTYATFHPSYLLRNDDTRESSDMHKAYETLKKAFMVSDMYAWLYEGRVPPMRGDEWAQFPKEDPDKWLDL